MCIKLDCLDLKVGHIWYDTVDQPVIPVTIKNKCESNVIVVIHVKTPSKELIHKSSQIRLHPNEEKTIEITVSYYGDVEIAGEWMLEEVGTWWPLSPIKAKL